MGQFIKRISYLQQLIESQRSSSAFGGSIPPRVNPERSHTGGVWGAVVTEALGKRGKETMVGTSSCNYGKKLLSGNRTISTGDQQEGAQDRPSAIPPGELRRGCLCINLSPWLTALSRPVPNPMRHCRWSSQVLGREASPCVGTANRGLGRERTVAIVLKREGPWASIRHWPKVVAKANEDTQSPLSLAGFFNHTA